MLKNMEQCSRIDVFLRLIVHEIVAQYKIIVCNPWIGLKQKLKQIKNNDDGDDDDDVFICCEYNWVKEHKWLDWWCCVSLFCVRVRIVINVYFAWPCHFAVNHVYFHLSLFLFVCTQNLQNLHLCWCCCYVAVAAVTLRCAAFIVSRCVVLLLLLFPHIFCFYFS